MDVVRALKAIVVGLNNELRHDRGIKDYVLRNLPLLKSLIEDYGGTVASPSVAPAEPQPETQTPSKMEVE